MVKNLKDLMKKFSDETKCREMLIQQRWNGSPVCPYCNHTKYYVIEGGKRFKCANQTCYKKYSVTVGTVFEASNIPLTTWFPAMYLIASHKKGISSIQLSKDLGVTQKTAWFMLHRIRESLKDNHSNMLGGIVQADETFVGGINKNRHKSKKHFDQTGKEYDIKAPVMGAIETGGKVKTRVINAVTKKNATSFISDNVQSGVTLVTDSHPSYFKVGNRYEHKIINHSHGQFVVNGFHTNGIENYWSVLKRGIYGIYHQVSPKHLQRYCDEFAYRFNSRDIKDGARFEIVLTGLQGRLKYADLIAKPKIEDNTPFIETGDDI
jgi:transposase-like protein